MKVRASFAVFVYAIAANVPVWLASRLLSLSMTGLFNIEFLIVGVLSVFLRRTLGICLLLAAIALDLLNCISKTYLFSVSELFLSAPSLFEFAPSHLWNLVVLTICIVFVSLLAVFALKECPDRRERKYIGSALFIVAILGVAVDCSTGQVLLFHPDRQLGHRLIRSSISSFTLRSIEQANFRRQVGGQTEEPIHGASTRLAELDLSGDSARTESNRPNVVFVLVESWGKHLSNEVDDSLVRPYLRDDLAARYTVSRGTVPFHGPTVAGELRELCGTTMSFGVVTAPASRLKNCLPARFDSMGYHTVGVHGFSARMFDRYAWYRKMGFDETWFRDQLKGQGLPACPGAFPGICDAAASGWIGARLETGSAEPQFIYWVTLNSHLPVPVPNLVKDPPACSGIGSVANDGAMCSWYQLIFNVHRSVSELAMKRIERPTVFVIVGDHAPPFASAELREQFSDTVVPYVVLWPKNGLGNYSQSTRSIAARNPVDRTRKPPLKKGKTAAQPSISG